MFKYRVIVKVLLGVGEDDRIISHLLLTDSNDFQVDLGGECCFNKFPVATVLNEFRVDSLKDVLDYCKERSIEIPSNKISKGRLLVGGEENFLIDKDLRGDWINNNGLVDSIVDFIVKEVQTKSIESGFQYMVSVESIENMFNITLDSDYIKCIEEILACREEVADVELDRNEFTEDIYFDVVLYTDYAPNYCEDLMAW